MRSRSRSRGSGCSGTLWLTSRGGGVALLATSCSGPRSPDPVEPGLGDGLDPAEMPREQLVQGDAALHHHLKAAAGRQVGRRLCDQAIEERAILGDALVQRRIVEDGV